MRKRIMFVTEVKDGVTDDEIKNSFYQVLHPNANIIERDTLTVIDAIEPRIEQRERGADIFVDDDAVARVQLFDGDSYEIMWYSTGYEKPSQARAVAFALLKAAEIAEQMPVASATPPHERQGNNDTIR